MDFTNPSADPDAGVGFTNFGLRSPVLLGGGINSHRRRWSLILEVFGLVVPAIPLPAIADGKLDPGVSEVLVSPDSGGARFRRHL